MMSENYTGGCQCGAVRFSAESVGRPSVCHCRMCQKSFGGLFGPLVTGNEVKWTRGEPKWFASSNLARRGFCGNCGTPLSYITKYGTELAIGAFDDPSAVGPVIQVNMTDKLDCYNDLSSLPIKLNPSGEWTDFMAEVKSNQHPDHDTDEWPSGEKS